MLLGLSRRLLLKRWTLVLGAPGSKSNCHTFRRDRGRWSDGVLEYWEEALVRITPLLQDSITPLGTVSNAYTKPLPAAKKTSGRPFTAARDGADHVLWKMFGAMCSSSRATKRPVCLSSTTRLGASGVRMRLWVLSTPVPVFR